MRMGSRDQSWYGSGQGFETIPSDGEIFQPLSALGNNSSASGNEFAHHPSIAGSRRTAERDWLYLAATTDCTVTVPSFVVPLTVTFCPASLASSASCPSRV